MCLCLVSLSPLCQEDINAMEMEDDKRDLISREISKFRDTHKVMYLTAPITLELGFGGNYSTLCSLNILNSNRSCISYN